MTTTARVNLWGRMIGAVSLEDEAATATFEYDPAFIRSGIEVAPLTMPLSGKEARETHYWLRLLRDLDILDAKHAGSVIEDCEELLKISGSIIKTTKLKIPNS